MTRWLAPLAAVVLRCLHSEAPELLRDDAAVAEALQSLRAEVVSELRVKSRGGEGCERRMSFPSGCGRHSGATRRLLGHVLQLWKSKYRNERQDLAALKRPHKCR